MNDYELYHHGVKGQKWGVRRTAAQLGHRVAKAAGKAADKAKKAAAASMKQRAEERRETKHYEKLKKKDVSQMTDKELADLTSRIKREASLKDAKYESRVQNARKFYKTVAQQPVNSFANTLGVNIAKIMTGQELNKKEKKKNSGEN